MKKRDHYLVLIITIFVTGIFLITEVNGAERLCIDQPVDSEFDPPTCEPEPIIIDQPPLSETNWCSCGFTECKPGSQSFSCETSTNNCNTDFGYIPKCSQKKSESCLTQCPRENAKLGKCLQNGNAYENCEEIIDNVNTNQCLEGQGCFSNACECVKAECSDGKDNKDTEDELIDAKDPGCHYDGNPDNPKSYEPWDNDEFNEIEPPQKYDTCGEKDKKCCAGDSCHSGLYCAYDGLGRKRCKEQKTKNQPYMNYNPFAFHKLIGEPAKVTINPCLDNNIKAFGVGAFDNNGYCCSPGKEYYDHLTQRCKTFKMEERACQYRPTQNKYSCNPGLWCNDTYVESDGARCCPDKIDWDPDIKQCGLQFEACPQNDWPAEENCVSLTYNAGSFKGKLKEFCFDPELHIGKPTKVCKNIGQSKGKNNFYGRVPDIHCLVKEGNDYKEIPCS